eukprot:4030521-Amphidinium_carterae.2
MPWGTRMVATLRNQVAMPAPQPCQPKPTNILRFPVRMRLYSNAFQRLAGLSRWTRVEVRCSSVTLRKGKEHELGKV